MAGDEHGLRAAVAAGVVGSEESFRTLLAAVAEVSRQIFAAKASSILLLDEGTNELVFEAVGGYGEEQLIGMRFPAGTGIDVQNDPRFAADFAKGTGYVPQGLMAVPLLHEERALGVLEVLDRPQQSRFSLEEMELLGLFANQSAIALDLMQRAREAEAVLNESESELAVVADLAARIDTLEGARREAGIELMRTLTAML
jgi:GAF domain-containing protein